MHRRSFGKKKNYGRFQNNVYLMFFCERYFITRKGRGPVQLMSNEAIELQSKNKRSPKL